ncbi:hypothetical protein MM221_01920 [Salipaludibacillus sp. LMS25]|jgi:hypothetical protein|uniref:hypothetical protein n=1 Tax=Salipaludibacillus sp. LMS25 TaxID=2924031 RepID=UPI0020D1062A|nr:hypothetical protein [Salipaludibacillus sp. LMS25]UTR15375.1 hypothetical protein MM221_01920 [Salipaludibacillus sp. LMS25]
MLTITFSYSTALGISPILFDHGFTFHDDHYRKTLTSAPVDIVFKHHNAKQLLLLTCEENVSFSCCKELYYLIDELAHDLSAKIDDKEALMGYDQRGEPAYLYHGFPRWATYIDKARQHSMEGTQVEIWQHHNRLARGVLVNCPGDENTSYTLITSEGEQTFYGDLLTVYPTLKGQ